MNVAPAEAKKFSWIPIYCELARKILGYRARQSDLIAILRELQEQELPVGSISDRDKSGKTIPLTEIDPFTFFTAFNRGVRDDNRRKILQYLKTRFSLESPVPSDFDGIPVANAQAAWFFGYQFKRKADDIPSLWKIAETVVSGPPEQLDASLYERCLSISSVGRAKLTMGMFWCNPEQYIAWDANNRSLLASKGIENEIKTWADYLDLIKAVKEKFGQSFPEISRRAWDLGKGKPGDRFVITEAQLQKLWGRFRQRISGFEDFSSPGGQLAAQELDYKRNALTRYQQEIGNDQLQIWIAAGEGDKAREEISKRIQANLVAFQSWRTSLGQTATESTTILAAFLKAAGQPYSGPGTVQPIIDAIISQGLKPSWDSLSTVLWAMRPTDYFPIKISYYRELAEELGHSLPSGPPTADKFDELMQFGKTFREALAPQKPKDWVDIQSFIWVVCPRSESARQYWAGGHQWGEDSKLQEFVAGDFWQIGWDKNDSNSAARKTWTFFDQVKIGDEFAIKGLGGRNDLRIYYVGEVIEKQDDNGILKFKRLERPLYRGKGPVGLSGATWFDTLIPINESSIIGAIFNGEVPGSGPEVEKTTKPVTNAKNIILYGPPGTGKTYQTIDRALDIIDATTAGERASKKKRFDELVRSGRIEFITFHQSYSYEDFVEGIRPSLDIDSDDGSPRYECRPGVFKRIATEAFFSCLRSTSDLERRPSFDALWNTLIAKIESEPEARYEGLSERTSYQLELTAHGNIEATNVVSSKKFYCSRKILEQVYEAKRQQKSITVSEVMEVVSRGCHSQLIAAVFKELRRIEDSESAKEKPSLAVGSSYEQRTEIVQRFLTKGVDSGYEMKAPAQWPNYVLVIDEVNRGNISKILGELITLLEPDKRWSPDNESSIVATLPYSGEKFAVPGNLFVVATMNTADKSIALVDIALRRRFDFEEIEVDLSVCCLPDEMVPLITELNRRILLRKDRDHQIGHAYFMNVRDEASFNECFRRKVIPLLQEYFYNDWDSLRFVLGENGTSDGKFVVRVPGAGTPGARTHWQWKAGAELSVISCFESLRENFSKAEA